MMHRPNENIKLVHAQQALDRVLGSRPDPINLHANEKLNFRRIRLLKPVSLVKVVVELLRKRCDSLGRFDLAFQQTLESYQHRAWPYFLRIEILNFPRHVLRQSVRLHLHADRSLDDFFESVLCMTAELSRVTMMGERHDPFKRCIGQVESEIDTLHRIARGLTLFSSNLVQNVRSFWAK